MSDKVIAVMDKPKDCQNCVWGICRYSMPLSTNRKGYYCQLKAPKDRTVGDFAYEDEVHLSDCPLTSLEEHNKEIRNKAIDEFFEELRKYEDDDMWLRLKISSIYEIAEQVKEVEE